MSDPDVTPPVASSDASSIPHPIGDALDAQMDKTLTTIPAGKTGQATITASLKGIEGELSTRLRWGWELGVWGASEWHGTPAAGARLRKEW